MWRSKLSPSREGEMDTVLIKKSAPKKIMGPRSQNDQNKRLGNDFYLSWRVRGELGLAQSEEIEVGVLCAYIDESDIGGDDCV